MVSYANFSIEEGKLGKGPRLTAVVNFINSGNRPVILTRISASFSSSADGPLPSNCEISGGNWTGMPWSYSEAHGEGFSQALPRVVPPGVAAAGVTWFEPLPVALQSENQAQSVVVCVEYEVLDPYGETVQKRAPIGIVKFNSDRVTELTLDEGYRDPVLISE